MLPGDEDYYLDDEEDSGLDAYEIDSTEDEEERATEEDYEDDVDSDISINLEHSNKFTEREKEMIALYDKITKWTKSGESKDLDATTFYRNVLEPVLTCDPRNTSQVTIQKLLNDFCNTQGRSRKTMTFLAEGAKNEINLDDEEADDEAVNKKLFDQQAEIVSRFVEYLANRDLSKDSPVNAKRKQRQLPAFIIFLFSTGNANLIKDCETLPDVYKKQVTKAIKDLTKMRYDLVEELAQRYDKLGHKKIAQIVREEGFSFFDREPAQLKTIVKYAPIITEEDIKIYKTDVRPRYMNITNTITQDVASDLIQVCEDEKKQIYKPMKNKTRFEAIQDVKTLFDNWKKENYDDSELAERILWTN